MPIGRGHQLRNDARTGPGHRTGRLRLNMSYMPAVARTVTVGPRHHLELEGSGPWIQDEFKVVWAHASLKDLTQRRRHDVQPNRARRRSTPVPLHGAHWLGLGAMAHSGVSVADQAETRGRGG